ncbi:MAG: hypothetical protein M1837_005708 [Sclerophora amabilis]|nr:MAG: hypothetical protein M1837_005708 [Sclerophora amabilis]
MLPEAEECTEGCVPPHLRRRLQSYPASTIALSALPFLLTFFIVGAVVLQKLFPVLSGQSQTQSKANSNHDRGLPFSNADVLLSPSSPNGARSKPTSTPKRAAAMTFAATIALATVLAELLLCEISNTLNPAVRTVAMNTTISLLLALLIVVTPLLELHSIITSAGWRFSDTGSKRVNFAWALEMLGFAIWMTVFWWVGHELPGTHFHRDDDDKDTSKSSRLSEACLERIGVIGISLMALLAGFASISSPWQNFGARVRPVRETDIARKQAGLEATEEMLETKRSRLRALERKMAEAPREGFVTKVIGTIRGSADTQERKSLELEVSGLETMQLSLSSSLSMLQTRRTTQQRSSSARGRVLLLISYVFSVYCLYRIVATSIATVRRWWYPGTTFSNSDPINNMLALVAKHWDPSLDRLAWSRQISFLLSGVILLASFSSVLQTFYFFSRFTPSVIHTAHANLALLVSQISATYVISSALLLRSNLPREVGSVISEALGAPLDAAFVERWFEGWFLTASGVTAVGILVGRKFGGEWDDLDDYDEDGWGVEKRL